MGLEALKNLLPEYAKDQKLNLGSLLAAPELTPVQVWGTALACAIAARNATVLAHLTEEARHHLSPELMDAARGAATIMGMNNVYYRYNHMLQESGDPEYSTMPARLRMQIIAKNGAEKLDFELWCLAVSAINGCSACVVSHEKVCRDKGASKATIHTAVKIAAVVKATADALFSEESLPSA
jgi:lipoyl-dependent peroxiredoxin subunit D